MPTLGLLGGPTWGAQPSSRHGFAHFADFRFDSRLSISENDKDRNTRFGLLYNFRCSGRLKPLRSRHLMDDQPNAAC